MPSQQLLLSWKDHNGALVSVFENLLKKNALVDCTLAAEGQYLKAHKVVLSACSSYFELLFSQESEKNPIVILKDVKFQELEAAVNFMYRGEVEVCEDRLAAFLEVADSLQIKGLGSDGRSQSSKEKPSAKSSSAKSAVTPRQQPRKETLNSRSDNAGQSPNVGADCEPIRSNESSLGHQSSRSESSRASPSLPLATSFTVGSSRSGRETRSDQDNLESTRSSSSAVPPFASGDNEQSEVNPVIKIEPVIDSYADDKSDDGDRDFGDDITMMEDQEDWDEQNVETMSDEHSTNQQDLGYPSEHMKTEDGSSENVEGAPSGNHPSSEGADWIQQDDGQNFSSIFVKEEPSTSSAWGHQEAYGGTEGGAGAGPSASTGAQHFPQLVRVASWVSALSQTPAAGGRLSHRSHRSASNSDTSRGASLLRAEPHQGKDLLTCTVCNVAFSRIVELKKHMRCHDAKYKCPRCSYAATRTSALKVHYRVHSGEKPFKCSLCSYTSSVRSSLTKHILTHTGQKLLMCHLCEYKTNHRCHLNSHLRIHSGEKPYKCQFCEYAAADSSNLAKHKLKHLIVKSSRV